MTTWNWTDFSGWMSDDSFLGRKWEFLDCENIDIVNNVRYVSGSYEVGSPSEIGSTVWEEVVAVKDWIYPAYCTANHTFVWGYDTTTNAAGAYKVEQIGTSTLPITFFFQNWAIKQVKFDWASSTLVWTISLYVPPWIPTATCIGAWRIYFAVANKLYSLITNAVDPTTTACTMHTSPMLDTIPFGYVIKAIYLYNDVLTVVANSNDSTHIYQLIETSTSDEWAIRYTHKVSWVKAIWGVGENNNMYWFSTKSLYLTNGTESQKIKVIGKDEWDASFATDSLITIRDSSVFIADDTTLYEFGSVKPWYNKVLTKHVKNIGITAIDWDLQVYYASSKIYADRVVNQSLFDNWSVTSLPYEAWMFNQPKTWTSLRVGHILPKYSSYTSTSTLASLDIAVLTDEMEQNWATPIIVRSITTPVTWVADRYTDISVQEINDVLTNYSSDFQYIKLVVTGNWWDATSVTGFWTYYRKTPKLFGINLVHNDILWNQ